MQLNGKGVGVNSLFFGGIASLSGINNHAGMPYNSIGGMGGHTN